MKYQINILKQLIVNLDSCNKLKKLVETLTFTKNQKLRSSIIKLKDLKKNLNKTELMTSPNQLEIDFLCQEIVMIPLLLFPK